MHRPTLPLLAVLALAALAACDRESPEQRQARIDARVASCIAQELAIDAKGRQATLDTALARAQAEQSPTLMITTAAHAFAAAYRTYADARWNELAMADSAVNAGAPEDSAEFARRGAGFRAPPAASSVEVNAARDWQRDFGAARANPAHPCHQEAAQAAER